MGFGSCFCGICLKRGIRRGEPGDLVVQFPLRLLEAAPELGLVSGLHWSHESDRQDSPKDSKSPLTKFALVNYYLLFLARSGLVAWLSDI